MANNREWLLDDSQYARVDPVNFIGPITYKTFLKQNKVTLVDSQKENKKAEYMGFLFVLDKLSKPHGSKQYWRCEKFSSKDGGCRARLHTYVQGIVFIQLLKHLNATEEGHNHAVNPSSMAVAQAKSNMKRKAVTSQDNAPVLVAASLNKSAVRHQLRRTRIKQQVPVVQANAVQEVIIPDELKFYEGVELFLLADSGKHVLDPDRVMIFGRERNIEWANRMENAYFDGTYSITPPPFTQVYAVMVEKNAANPAGGKYVFPILFALLKNKNRATYDKLFGMVKALMPQFTPLIINVDFEQAVIHSLQEAFPGSSINGCLYHLVKNFKKQIGNAGLMALYRDPATNFALTSKMLISLAFVPPLSVYESFRELKVYLMREQPLLKPVINWFSSNYELLCDRRHFQFTCGRAMIEQEMEKIGRTILPKQRTSNYHGC